MVMPALAIAPMTATYCAQLRGAAAAQPECTFKNTATRLAPTQAACRGHRCAADGPSFAPSVATELRPLTPPPLAAA